jgi:glycosyltransferase involved in cell wall biosynthesis
MKNVIIFRSDLLYPSETFIRSQALALKRYQPLFVGFNRVDDGLELPKENTIILKAGSKLDRMRELMFKAFLCPSRVLVKRLEALSPALIHAHFAYDAVYALPIAHALNVPLLVTFHGNDVTVRDEERRKGKGISIKLFPHRRKRLIESEAYYIAVSEYIRNIAISRGYPEDRIRRHYIGVDLEQFETSHEVPTRPLVLFVGRLVEKKGCIYLIRAMQKVQKIRPDAELFIIGDGPLRPALEKEAAKLLTGYNFLGLQQTSVVRDYMRTARVVSSPSITADSGDSEGLPIVIYEAMATGRPVVSSLSAGIPEAVDHGKTGFLAQEKNVDALAMYILSLLNDDELWQQFSIAAGERCRSLFSLKKQATDLEKIYDEILQGESLNT